MKIENGVNLNKFDYFPLEEYVNRITVEDFGEEADRQVPASHP